MDTTTTYAFKKVVAGDYWRSGTNNWIGQVTANWDEMDDILDGTDPLKLASGATWRIQNNSAANLVTVVNNTGQVAITTTGTGGGLLIGGDAQWYRASSNVMRTPDALTVDGAFTGSTITGSGVMSTTDATEATSTTAASLKTAGGIACVKDIYAGDDIFFTSGAVLNFNSGDVTVTHSSNTITVTGGIMALDTASTIGNLTLGDGSITDSSGAIGFGNENLSTTGTLSSGATTVTSLIIDDITLSDGAANRLDLASGDSLQMVDGTIDIGGLTSNSALGKALRFSTGSSFDRYASIQAYRGGDAATIDMVFNAWAGGAGFEVGRFTTAGELRVPVTGSAAGILFGTDAKLYRGAANRLDLATGDNFSLVDGSVTINNSVNEAMLATVNTNTSTNGVTWQTHHDSASPADADTVFDLAINADDDTGAKRQIARFYVRFADVTSTTMDSTLHFRVMNAVNAGIDNVEATLSSAGVWTDSSDENAKRRGATVDQMWPDFWDRFMRLDTRAYSSAYLPDGETRDLHASPGAQQFYAEFGLGADPVNGPPGVAPKDLAGVSMIGVQKLYAKIQGLENEIELLKAG